MITKSNIEFKINRQVQEGVSDMNNEVFPSHFLCAICGKPGSGKTSLLKFILKSDQLLFKKFDYVFIVSPSWAEYKSLFLPDGNFCGSLDFDWIQDRIKDLKDSSKYVNILFILDDVIANLHKNSRSTSVLEFIFNRRHWLNNGMISIIITSQKYNYLPTAVRSNLTIFISFNLNRTDWGLVEKEIVYSDADFSSVLNYTFSTDKENNEDNFLVYRVDKNIFFKKFDRFNL